MGPDRLGQKIEFRAGYGSRTRPDQSTTVLPLSNSTTLQVAPEIWHARLCPFNFLGTVCPCLTAQPCHFHQEKNKKIAQIWSVGPTWDWTEDRIQQNYRPKTGPKRTGPSRSSVWSGLRPKTVQAYSLVGYEPLPNKYISYQFKYHIKNEFLLIQTCYFLVYIHIVNRLRTSFSLK